MLNNYNSPIGGHNSCAGDAEIDRTHCAAVRGLAALVESVAEEFRVIRSGYVRKSAWGQADPELTDSEAIREIGDCLEFLAAIRLNEKPNCHSYGLKHVIEQWNAYRYRKPGTITVNGDSETDTNPYIANGSLIVAAIIYGAPCKPVDPNSQDPNMYLGLNHYDIRDQMIGTGSLLVKAPWRRCECCELPYPADPCTPDEWRVPQ